MISGRHSHSSRSQTRGMATSSKTLLLALAALCVLAPRAMAQQQYNNTQGYACSSAKQACSAYALYRTFQGGETLATVAAYFNTSAASIANPSGPSLTGTLKAQQPLYIPLQCRCVNVTTQADLTRTIVSNDTFWLLSVTVYGGLTTMQAIETRNPTAVPTNLQIGQQVTIPIFCACPTATQAAAGTKLLLTYVVFPGDTLETIGGYFGVSAAAVRAANELAANVTALDSNTTVLVPLAALPPLAAINFTAPAAPAPLAPAAPPTAPPPAAVAATPTSQRPLYIGVAVGAFGMTLAAVMGALLLIKACQGQPEEPGKGLYERPGYYPSGGGGAAAGKDPEALKPSGFQMEMIAGMSDMVGSDKPVLFSYQELQAATQDFSEANNIQGSVYRGRLAGQVVAIKQMKGNMSQELKILCQVHHSNLVKLVGMCVGGSEHLFLVYEYAENGSLSDTLRNQAAIAHNKFTQSVAYLPWTPRVQIALDVASGLEYIHNYTNPSFVHKDVKSSNILLDADFRAKVANFGMAKSSASSGAGPLLTRHITGTQGYMAPEYLEHGLVTPKADVFAFGVVLLELLSGNEAVVREDEDGGAKERALSDIIHDVLDGRGDARGQMERLQAFMDPLLHAAYPLDTAGSVASLARTCVDADPGARPSMKDVTFALSKMLVASLEWESSAVFASSMSTAPIEAR